MILAERTISSSSSIVKSETPIALHETILDQAFHGVPGVGQGDPLVVNRLAARIPRVLIVSGLEGKGRMDQVEIDVIQPEPFAAGLEGPGNSIGPVVRVPEFRRDEHLLASDDALLKNLLHRLADLFLIAVSFRAVEMSKPCFHRDLGRGSCFHRTSNERAKTERRDFIVAVVQGHSDVVKSADTFDCCGHDQQLPYIWGGRPWLERLKARCAAQRNLIPGELEKQRWRRSYAGLDSLSAFVLKGFLITQTSVGSSRQRSHEGRAGTSGQRMPRRRRVRWRPRRPRAGRR